MNLILKNNRLLLLVYLILASVGLVLLLIYPKTSSFLAISSFHNEVLNYLFRFFSMLGNGFFTIILIALLSLWRIRVSIYLLLSYAASGILVQFLKRIVFNESYRPIKFFAEQGVDIYKVPGFDNYLIYSFPSGHTTSAFVVFIGIALLINNSFVKILMLLLAIMVGYSRIYLSQHFPEDVLAGSLVGLSSALIFYFWSNKWQKSWLDKSVVQLFSKK
jgi:membrane-associated phospholipid phosphatase